MNTEELTKKATSWIERLEREIIREMNSNNIQVYSFLNKKDKPQIVVNDKIDNIVALNFDGYTLGIILESDLTPFRRDFLAKADKFPIGDKTNAEIEKLSTEREDMFNGFILLVDNATYPTDTLLNIILYIDKEYN